MERILPNPAVKDRIAVLCVGFAVDCYAADATIAELCDKNLPEPRNAPMVGFLTLDGAWIDGFSGSIETAEFLQVLERVEKSPLLAASPAVQKQLEKLAATIGPAADKGDWPAVFTAARAANKSTGRCPERDAIQAAEQKARAWAATELDGVVHQAKAGGDLAALRKHLGVIKQKCVGEPEAVDAETGLKALQKLALVREVEAGGNPARDLRERHAAPFKASRWTAVFDKPVPPTDKK